jgi:hypothetical protein
MCLIFTAIFLSLSYISFSDGADGYGYMFLLLAGIMILLVARHITKVKKEIKAKKSQK